MSASDDAHHDLAAVVDAVTGGDDTANVTTGMDLLTVQSDRVAALPTTPSQVREERFSRLRATASVDTTKSIEERRMLVNRLLSAIFDEEIAQFLQDGVFDRPNSLLAAAHTKFLEFPPVQRDRDGFEKSLTEVINDLPDLIHAYNKATGKDFTKKLKKVTVGNLTLSLVPENVEIEGELDAILESLEKEGADSGKEHNFYQRQLLSLFSLFIAGLEQDGGTAAFANRIRAYHSIGELPPGMHVIRNIGTNKKRMDTLKRVHRVTPQSAIVGVLRMGSGSKVMSGVASLLLQKIGSYTLLQRLMHSRLDIDTVEAQREHCVQLSQNEPASRTLIAYIDERYPIAGGWQAFDCQAKILAALRAQVTGDFQGVHSRATETQQRRKSGVFAKAGDRLKAVTGRVGRKSENSSRVSLDASPSASNLDDGSRSPEPPSGGPSRTPSQNSIGTTVRSATYMTLDDITAMTDAQCGSLFHVAERELARQDLVALVEFIGSKAFNTFLDAFLTSLAGPLSEATHGGGMADLAQSMFKVVERAIEVDSSDYPLEKKRMVLDQQLQVFMADVYSFFQTAVTHDRGQFMQTLEWALESYSNTNGGLDLDYLLSTLSAEDQALLWNEVNHFIYWAKYKKFLKPGQCPQPTYISKLLPQAKRLLAEYFAPLPPSDTTIEERCESVDAVLKISALLASHLPQQASTSSQSVPKVQVITHLVISYLEHTNYVLEKQGFKVVEEFSKGSLGGDRIWVLTKLSPLNTDGISPIIDLDVSSKDSDAKKLQLAGWSRIVSNLNKGALFRSSTHVWYKRGDTTKDAAEAIDDIVVIFGDGKPEGPYKYTMVSRSPNKSSYTGRACYIWYRRVKDGPQSALLTATEGQ